MEANPTLKFFMGSPFYYSPRHGDDLQIYQDGGNNEFEECSYAVVGVEREFYLSREWEIDQKAAKLITELDGKGESGKAAIDFLRNTLDTYDKFRKLERIHELQSKKVKVPLNKDEEKLLKELLNNKTLSPFIEK